MTNFNNSDHPNDQSFPEAKVRKRYFSAIWLVPLIAAVVAGYLGVRSYVNRGPEITVSFRSGDGLTAGQTPVKYKSVAIGVVETIALNPDLSGVGVKIRMASSANSMLTENARLWVVRPRLNSANISSLETLVSGTYIQIEPGDPDTSRQKHYVGLETPPNVHSDEPGTTFVLKTPRLGSISAGTPVFFRDVNVGEVLGYDLGSGFGLIKVNILVRPPYDAFVKPATRFWNASGLTVRTGEGGIHVELQSLQSVLQGGIVFSTPDDAKDAEAAPQNATYKLYDSQKVAETADFNKPVHYVTYVQTAIKDLATGSPVQVFGVRVGTVTDVRLVFDSAKSVAKVRVAFDVQPDKAFGVTDPSADLSLIAHKLVKDGMRVRLESSDLVLGQEILSLEFTPGAQLAEVATEDDALVLPGEGGGMDHLTDAIGDIAGKLNAIPFDQIGEHLNHIASVADTTFAGPDMVKAIHSLEETLANAEDISKKANTNLTPALQKLPQISAELQDAVQRANVFMTSINTGYGQDSEFQRNSQRVLNEVNDAARSIRLLADFLERHPEALIQGKAAERSKQ